MSFLFHQFLHRSTGLLTVCRLRLEIFPIVIMGFIFVHLIRLKVGQNIVVDKDNELFKPNQTHVFYPSMRSGHILGSSSSGVFESYGVWSRQVDEFDFWGRLLSTISN